MNNSFAFNLSQRFIQLSFKLYYAFLSVLCELCGELLFFLKIASIKITGTGPRDNSYESSLFRRNNLQLKCEAFPLFFSRSMTFFLDHRSTKLIIPES
jgi:hypothetical protein